MHQTTITTTAQVHSRFDEGDRLVSTRIAAQKIGCAENTLAKARVYGGKYAIPHVKIGSAVKYSMRQIAEFVHANTHVNTAQHQGN